MTNPRRILQIILPVVLIAFVLVHIVASFVPPPLRLPKYAPIDTLIVLEQNWSDEEIDWYNHASQGGAFSLVIEYSWLRALERPEVPLFILNSPGKLLDWDYITRFGFLVSRKNYERMGVEVLRVGGTGGSVDYDTGDRPYKPLPEGVDHLPVGFTRTENWIDPEDPEQTPHDVVGFTCAACHTGQVNKVNNDGSRVGIRVQGGPAMTHLTNFENAVGGALLLTYAIPTRFNRFAQEVLGDRNSEGARRELRKELLELIKEGVAEKNFMTKHGINNVVEGFGRLDALGRIGNFVFGNEMNADNYVADDAPVSLPHVWDTPWFNWIQYNASIMQPMVRNAGEAMGVFARVDFRPESKNLFASTVDIDNLFWMEDLIRGDTAYGGLRSPSWPEEILGPIDRELAATGELLYKKYCQRCHFPPDIEDRRHRGNAHYWTPKDPYGNQYLRVHESSVYDIGTDPKVAANFIQRIVDLGRLGERFGPEGPDADPEFPMVGGYTPGGPALAFLVTKTIEKRYQDLGVSAVPDSVIGDTVASMRDIYNGLRPNLIQARLIYKARPLNGIWATSPYLHNGSVPDLWELLSPVEQRPVAFYVGTKAFDKDSVGYVHSRFDGGFLFDTRIKGNSNAGHEFRGSRERDADDFWADEGKGVIGPALTSDERLALIEYLKTL